MKELLEYIVKNIASHPESISIEEAEDDRTVLLTLKVAEEDMGRVIGRQGKTIQAIRTIIRVLALKESKRSRVEVLSTGEDEDGDMKENAPAQEDEIDIPDESLPEVEAEEKQEEIPLEETA